MVVEMGWDRDDEAGGGGDGDAHVDVVTVDDVVAVDDRVHDRCLLQRLRRRCRTPYSKHSYILVYTSMSKHI